MRTPRGRDPGVTAYMCMHEVLITLTVAIWLQRQMVFPNVIILSSNNIDYYYLATSGVSKCDHMYILSTIKLKYDMMRYRCVVTLFKS